MRQRPLTGRRRSMIALDHFRPFAALLLQLERRLEEVDVEPRRRVEADHHARCFYALEAAVAHQAAHDRSILLLDERLVVFLVGTRARHFELLSAAPWDDGVVHERAIVVEVDAAQKPGEQALHVFHRLDNKRAIARYQRQAFGPARGDIDHRQRLNEQARHRRAAMCDHVDLAVAWRRAVPVVERADRNLAPDRRVESCASPLVAAVSSWTVSTTRLMLFFDGRCPRRAWPVLAEYIRPNVYPRKSNSPSGTLQIRVFSSLTVSFSLPMISRSRCKASSALPFLHRITRSSA